MKWTLRASLWFKGKEERQKEKVTKKGSERKGVNLKHIKHTLMILLWV